MHAFLRCDEPGCTSLCFQGSSRCLAHHPDPARAPRQRSRPFSSTRKGQGYHAAGMAVEGQDLSRRKYIGCSFIGASFRNVLFTGSTFLLCFFDRAPLRVPAISRARMSNSVLSALRRSSTCPSRAPSSSTATSMAPRSARRPSRIEPLRLSIHPWRDRPLRFRELRLEARLFLARETGGRIVQGLKYHGGDQGPGAPLPMRRRV